MPEIYLIVYKDIIVDLSHMSVEFGAFIVRRQV